MLLRQFSKSIEKVFHRFIVQICSFIFRSATKKGMYRAAYVVGLLLFVIARRQRKTATSGFLHAYNGSMSPAEIKRLTRECFTSMAKSAAEMAFFVGKPGQIRESVRIEGIAHLRQGLSRGKGVVLVSAHFGNFPLMLGRLALEGYRASVIMRPLKNQGIERMFLPEARRLGVTPIYSIPRPECVKKSLQTLRDNGILFIPVDQNFGTGGVYVDFFNRKAATAIGSVVLAQRTGAAIIPCFIIRQPDDSHTIKIEPIFELEQMDSRDECVHSALQKITGIVEKYVRLYPQEWAWIHKRWKSRPKKKLAAGEQL
jgi:Kdo2-lipid IVA lauroyltransferase/acyltransferase